MEAKTGYRWRQISPKQRAALLAARQREGRPWHTPPHFATGQSADFHITAACYEHRPLIGLTEQRMENFSRELLATLASGAEHIHAWCVLPNHYHALIRTAGLPALAKSLGRLHGRNSFVWNREENTRGRQAFHGAADRAMRSEAHFWATLNYIHHNPVHHGYVGRWTDWPWSSANEYLEKIGRDEALRIWRAFPLHDYGKGWDDASL